VALGLVCVAGVAQARPEWVERHGLSSAHPSTKFVTGYGVAKGDDALARAKQEASADLARQLSVRIESEVEDVSLEKDGEYRYRLAAMTRTTADLRLTDLHYDEPYVRRGRVYVLAWVERGPAARGQAAARDRALVALRQCLASGEEAKRAGHKRAALATLEDCRRFVAETIQHDAVARALRGVRGDDAATQVEIIEHARRLDREIESVLTEPARSLSGAAETLALQLARQGVSNRSRLFVSHLSYGTTDLSSSFGRRVGLDLERALARTAASADSSAGRTAPRRYADLSVTGSYFESGDSVRLGVTAREVATGRLVASAETVLPSTAIPSDVELKPANFDAALRDQRILREGGLGSGDLRVWISTERGRGGLVYSEKEVMRLFVRVDRPAWVRLLYVLQNGAQVPIDEGFRIGEDEVGLDIPYPVDFEIVPPFGIEMVHATAFTERPPPLVTDERVIAGQRYVVVTDGLRSVVRTRGLAVRRHEPIAEDTLTVTTVPRLESVTNGFVSPPRAR